MDIPSKPHQASCHCGSVVFEVQLTDGFNTIRRCSCSYCRMRGAVAVSAQLDGISPFDFAEVVVNDGVNHPSDAASGPLIAGVLRFSAT